MKNLILILFVVFTTTIINAQTAQAIEYVTTQEGVEEVTTLEVKLSDSVVKCYQDEKGNWIAVVVSKKVITKEELEKQVLLDADLVKQIAARKENYEKIKASKTKKN